MTKLVPVQSRSNHFAPPARFNRGHADAMRVAADRLENRPRDRALALPYLHRTVGRAGEHVTSGGVEPHTPDPGFVLVRDARQPRVDATRGCLPYCYRTVVAASHYLKRPLLNR